MQRQTKEYTIANSITPVAVTSSTDATPIVVTATSHGLATGDMVVIFGHTTNVAANGIFKVVKVNANSFQLTDRHSGANVAGSGAGAGASGVMAALPKILLTSDFRSASFSLHTAGSASMTLKVALSHGKLDSDADANGDAPNFGATVADTNPYTYAAIVDLEDGSTVVEGDTGIVLAGTDVNKTYEVNTNLQKYLCIFPTAWTAGSYTIKMILSTDAQ